MKITALILVAMLTLISCSDNTFELEQQLAMVKPITCDDFQAANTEMGLLYNNVWNKQAAHNHSSSQCLISRIVEGKTQFGWSWDWPQGNPVIYAYPQIKVGASPWQPEPNFNKTFPVKIASLTSLSLSCDLAILSNGNYNIASSMWITKTAVTGAQAQPASIAAEIMVWTFATQHHFSPGGQKTDEFTLGEQTWEVWLDKNWQDASGANANKWIYIAFKAKTNTLSHNIDMLGLLHYALAKQFIESDYYVADVELGNELMGGKGLVWINSFNVSLQQQANAFMPPR